MLRAAAKQPISIAINSNSLAFYQYKSGVLDTDKCGPRVNHAVNIVGFGTDQATGKPYWIIKNSWGSGWGENGFIRIKRDTTNGGVGICGINKLVSYPTL